MRIQTWFVMGGVASVNAAALYGAFRVSTLVVVFQETGSWLEVGVAILFFFAEFFVLANAIGYFLNILIASFQYRRDQGGSLALKIWPEVIVFLPMKNEQLALIEKTFLACKYLTYPKRKVVVVDSSDAREHQLAVRALAEKYGHTYFMTPYPRHGAKAGALNEAMAVFVAPFYAIFDADYRPSRDFIERVVPILVQRPTCAYVQTPQFYGNLIDSPVSRISQIQQSIFYEYICEGKSVHNSMFMCGTNIMVRRDALASVGWWDEGSITEDYSTSMELAKHGWDSRYYSQILATGVGPVNLRAYLRQQYRWSRGTLGTFFHNLGPILNPSSRLSLFQRIEYSLSGHYFFVGVVWLALILMPVSYIFFRIPAYTSDPFLFSAAYLPYMILSFAFYGITMGYRGFRITDLLKAQSLTFITLPVYVRALLDAMMGRKAVFQTTSKDGSPYEVPWDELRIQLVLVGVNVAAVVYGLATFLLSTNKPALLTNIIWAAFHAGVMLYFIFSLYAHKYRAHAARDRNAPLGPIADAPPS